MTGPRRPAALGVVHQLRIGLDRGRAARAPERRDRARERRQPLADRIARDGAHHERGLLADASLDRQRDRDGLAAEHVQDLRDDGAQHLPQIDDAADGAADLVNGDQLAHARRQALLVLAQAAGHDPERLGDVADLVVGVDREAGVEIAARDGERARVQVLQRPRHAPREQVRQHHRQQQRRQRAQDQRRARAPARGGQRLAIDGDAEQTDRAPGHVLQLTERDRVGMALDLQRNDRRSR